jgi:hypothetical protein
MSGGDLTTVAASSLAKSTAGGQVTAMNQGLTLVHFSAQPEPLLTQNTP